jgi:hypothetical protein
MKSLTKIILLTTIAALAVAETTKQCEDRCYDREMKKDPNAIAALVWHECKYECERRHFTAPLLGEVKETEKECIDKCVKKKFEEDPEAIAPVVWHQCKWACEEQKEVAAPVVKETEKECIDKCVKKKFEEDPEAIAPVVWHQCKWACEEQKEVAAVKPAEETCDQPKCYDKCYCQQKAKGETVDAVIWHICHWQCDDSFKKHISASETPVNDKKCWDDCWAEEEKKETNPSVIYQICFFKCGPKPSSG